MRFAAFPETLLTGPLTRIPIPGWIKPLAPRVAKPDEIERLERLPALTVVCASRLESLLRHEAFLGNLSRQMAKTPAPSKIVVLLERRSETEKQMEMLVSLLGQFTRPSDLEVALGKESARNAVVEAVAKIFAAGSVMEKERAEMDPLSSLKKVIGATSDLRARSGKLSADRVANVFGLSVAELAALVGRSRQAVSKTDDAEALQPSLRPFERVARVRAALSDEEFRKWLHLPSKELGDRTPLDLIRAGRVSVIADLVEDMLTGSPT